MVAGARVERVGQTERGGLGIGYFVGESERDHDAPRSTARVRGLWARVVTVLLATKPTLPSTFLAGSVAKLTEREMVAHTDTRSLGA